MGFYAQSLRNTSTPDAAELRQVLALQLPFCFEVGSLSGSLVSSAPE
jgi:hypothetical protein